MFQLLLLIHVLGAVIWTGGHLVLVCVVLPRARRAGDAGAVRDFEAGFEPLAVPALVAQVASGAWLAAQLKPADVGWLEVGSYPLSHVALKVVAILAILALAVHAKLRVLPRLEEGDLTAYSRHALAVTVLSVGLVVMGVGLATGGYF